MRFKSRLKQVVHISGIGLHTGKSVNVNISQAEDGHGIKFIRTDFDPPVAIPADVAYVFTTQRGTTLKSGEATISTIEHLLAALNALDIEDVNVSVDGPEIPILDGSSDIFIKKLLEAGLEKVESTKEEYIITESFNYVDPTTGSEFAVYPSDKFEVNVILNFPENTLGDMVAVLKDKSQFTKEIANARTFVFLTDIAALFDAGLIKGGDLDNAVVIVDKQLDDSELMALKAKIGKPNASIENGLISSTPLRHQNEPARHKILDILGDFALIGRDIRAKIVATKPGHTANIALAKILKNKYLEHKKNAGRPIYDPTVEPVLNTEQIKNYLPHRYPFLMVDKVIEITPTYIVGVKNVTFNDNYFMGHFPGNPIFPGVLQMEALAQTGGILALTTLSDGQEQWDTYFLKMDNVKFKAKVVPGDTLILKMELMSPIRRGIIQMMGTAYVGSKIVSEGELTAQIVKRQND
ncbi:MAG: bifunctional UDP-3-O-[3-hydroxymyristoyl] N-acetylglucosamine deacetylase/3-hydroxyacyl-ACP dehydratase [Saprospiraceae bacterium]|nr:bifunctional UDP-3-O-[3-hydroxymyristoyl] N-acetylglucosamine deacetylase/3-hydroxyacyl-ACP dehydratase [Saprospiraceae bacterium]